MKLYRGENWGNWMEIQKNDCIQPKGLNFELTFNYNNLIRYDGSSTYGLSLQNAINGHQICSRKFITSGISTTPYWGRARNYALNNGKYCQGVIFEININNIINEEVELFEVNKLITNPNFKEDNEVIIKRKDNKPFQLSWFKIHKINI